MANENLIHEHHHVGVKLTAGEEAEAVAAVVAATYPEAQIEHHPAYISIVVPHRLVFDLPRISEELGRAYDVPTFLVILSSYHGRVVVEDDRVTLTSEVD
jgi:hypothetical protein